MCLHRPSPTPPWFSPWAFVLYVIRGGRWEGGGSGMVLMACRLLKPDHIHSLPPPWQQHRSPPPALLGRSAPDNDTHTPQNGCINGVFFFLLLLLCTRLRTQMLSVCSQDGLLFHHVAALTCFLRHGAVCLTNRASSNNINVWYSNSSTQASASAVMLVVS